MGRLVVIVLGVLIIGGGAAYYFNIGGFRGKVTDVTRSATGYAPAEKPLECLDRFREAIKNRKYSLAADVYLTGPYADQMRKGAEGGEKLGEAIDNLTEQLNTHGYDSDKIKVLLSYLEPFPKDLKGVVEGESGDKAYAVFGSDTVFTPKTTDVGYYSGAFDLEFMRAMSKGLPAKVEMLKTTGEKADKKSWRLAFPNPPLVQVGVDKLAKKYKTYVKALEALKYSVTNEKMPKSDLEEKFRMEIEKCARD